MGIRDEEFREMSDKLMTFLAETARSKKITQAMIAEHTGFAQSNVARLERCAYSPTLSVFLKYASAVGVQLGLYTRNADSRYDADMPKFLMVPDHQAMQLYILHNSYPACLIHVVQTIPATFRVVVCFDKEDNLDEVITDAKAFYKEYAERMDVN